MNNTEKIKFPILYFKEGRSFIYFLEKENDLLDTTEKLLKDDMFRDFVIVDGNGLFYRYKEVRKIVSSGFFGINIVVKRWLNDKAKRVEIEFESNIEQLELSNLKSTITQKVESKRDFLKDSLSLEDLKKTIEEAKTFEELILIFK